MGEGGVGTSVVKVFLRFVVVLLFFAVSRVLKNDPGVYVFPRKKNVPGNRDHTRRLWEIPGTIQHHPIPTNTIQ